MAKIAFLGLGVMGYPMAGHLLTAGFGVQGYDVRPEAAAALAEAGGVPAASPAEAAAGAQSSRAPSEADIVKQMEEMARQAEEPASAPAEKP